MQTNGAGPSSSPSPARGWQGFDNDAFAANQNKQETDPWARMRQQPSAFGQQFTKPQETNPWAAFQMPSNGFGFQSQHLSQPQQQYQSPAQRFGQGRMPTPPDEDEEMDMDDNMNEESDGEDEFDGRAQAGQRASGFGQGGVGMEDKRAFSLTQIDHDQQTATSWQRGRRKT
jgi:hypothetical protein